MIKLNEWGDGSKKFRSLAKFEARLIKDLNRARAAAEERWYIWLLLGDKKFSSEMATLRTELVEIYERQLALLLEWKAKVKGLTPEEARGLAAGRLIGEKTAGRMNARRSGETGSLRSEGLSPEITALK
jgi:hypothetical protein